VHEYAAPKSRIDPPRSKSAGKPRDRASMVEQAVHSGIADHGQELEPPVRAEMESRFAHDFSRVRIHTLAAAEASADILDANAYTVGRDIVFGKGQYAPHTERGQQLLAHELAHTVQQNNTAGSGAAGLRMGRPGDLLEQEAEAAAQSARYQSPLSFHPTPVGLMVQRQPRTPSAPIHQEKPIEITVTQSDLAQLRLKQGEAQQAISHEVEQAVKAIQQGHRQGYANFKLWYRGWEKAKEESSTELAKKICGFLLEKGLDIIFPEEELFITLLKKAATKGYELAADNLGKIDVGDVNGFLDIVGAAEEDEITALLDAEDELFKNKPEEVDAAVASFIGARDAGWASTEQLPPETLEILQQAGIGLHGSAAATVCAERVLIAHIEAVLRTDPAVVAGSGGASLRIMAEVAALRQMQKLPSVDNRERIWNLEQGLPPFFRTMADINSESALMLHIQLGIDQDDSEKIVKSRKEQGPFSSASDLLSRKLLSNDDFKKVEGRVVCH